MKLRSSSHSTGGSRPAGAPGNGAQALDGSLIGADSLSSEDMAQIAQYQGRTGAGFSEAAVELGLIAPEAISQALARQVEAGELVDPDVAGISRAIVAAYDPEDPLAVRLRELRSTLLTVLDLDGDRMPVVVIAGCDTDDTAGVAANLATLFAQLGHPGLIVDANFAAPTQHALFGLDPEVGATSLLTGVSVRDDCAVATPITNLDLIAAGPAIGGLSEAVERVSLVDQVRAIRGGYRFAIIDAGNQATDVVAAIGRGADGALLLVERRHSSLRAVRLLSDRFDANQIPLLGSIVIG